MTIMSTLGAVKPPAGFAVGHHTDRRALTGCTVVLCGDKGARGGVSVAGGAPGTRETDLLAPGMLVGEVHAVLLTGGSAYGLDAAGGVMAYLEKRGIGFPTSVGPVPIVPAAVLFDLALGSASVRPDAAAGRAACEAARCDPIEEGSCGAGTGASVGKLMGMRRAMKGGLGASEVRLPGGGTVVAIAVANSLGEVVDAETGRVLAGIRDGKGGFVPAETAVLSPRSEPPPFGNTTLACVMTDLELDGAELRRIAARAQDGLARAVRPSHTPFDGDTIFLLASGASGIRGEPLAVGVAAVWAMARALARAVTETGAAGGLPSYREPGS